MNNLNEVLEERGNNYGNFRDHAALAQDIKYAMKSNIGYTNLSKSQKESLEMIAHKMARIINGNPDYVDSWTDIAGYAQLIVRELTS